MKSLTSITAQAMRDAGVRPIAKSLHTITALVNVANHIRHYLIGMSVEESLDTATIALKLDGMPDPHGLKAAALKQLTKHSTKATV